MGTMSRVGFGFGCVAKVQERGDAVAAVVEEDVSALDDVEISRADGGQQAVGATARARGDVDDVARRGPAALIQARERPPRRARTPARGCEEGGVVREGERDAPCQSGGRGRTCRRAMTEDPSSESMSTMRFCLSTAISGYVASIATVPSGLFTLL